MNPTIEQMQKEWNEERDIWIKQQGTIEQQREAIRELKEALDFSNQQLWAFSITELTTGVREAMRRRAKQNDTILSKYKDL